jgi:hypothetical protein
MNLGELLTELRKIVISTSDDDDQMIVWLNRAIGEISNDFDFPSLALLQPITIPVTQDEFIYSLPEDFQKKPFKVFNGDFLAYPGNPFASRIWLCHDWDELDRKDITHLETGERVTHAAFQTVGMDSRVGIYPRANDTLYVWYYKRPPKLVDNRDEPRWMPEDYHYRVIVPKVIIKNFQLLQDLIKDAPHQSLAYWEEQYKKGLYGEMRGDIGLVHFLARNKQPRRHGGRDPLP